MKIKLPMSDVKWTVASDVKFVHMVVETIGHLELIDGAWVASNGDRYDACISDGVVTLIGPLTQEK